jgi:hypothetical protein
LLLFFIEEVTTPSETSYEVFDYFAVDKDEVLKIQTPSMKKLDNKDDNTSTIVDLKLQKNTKNTPDITNTNEKTDEKTIVQQEEYLDSTLTSSPAKPPMIPATNGITSSPTKTPRSQPTTSTSQEVADSTSDSAQISNIPKENGSVGMTPIAPATTAGPTNLDIRIQNIKAEAALELERLRKRLDVAKQDAVKQSTPITTATTTPPVTNVTSNLTSSSPLVSNSLDTSTSKSLTSNPALSTALLKDINSLKPTENAMSETVTKPEQPSRLIEKASSVRKLLFYVFVLLMFYFWTSGNKFNSYSPVKSNAIR